MEVLKDSRAKIDALDDQIIDLLAQRMEVVRAVGVIKSRENLSVVQPDRMVQVQERCAHRARLKGLNPALVEKIYTAIIDEAHDLEQAILAKQ